MDAIAFMLGATPSHEIRIMNTNPWWNLIHGDFDVNNAAFMALNFKAWCKNIFTVFNGKHDNILIPRLVAPNYMFKLAHVVVCVVSPFVKKNIFKKPYKSYKNCQFIFPYLTSIDFMVGTPTVWQQKSLCYFVEKRIKNNKNA